MTERPDEDPVFRSLAAPGLDEDDLYAAMHGLPGALWGDGRPWAPRPAEAPWDAATERRRRHEELMRRWQAEWGGGPAAGAPPG
jgi:hypothetical protein